MVVQWRKRRSTTMSWIAIAIAVLMCATPALAQSPEEVSAQITEWVPSEARKSVSAETRTKEGRVFISINGGLQSGPRDFYSGGIHRDFLSDTTVLKQSPLESDSESPVRTLLDASGGVRITRHFGVGVGVSRIGADFGHGDVKLLSDPGLRQETALHFQALAMLPAWRSVSVTLFGGPTWFNVKQFRARGSNNALGFNFGADVSYYFSDTVGVGWLIRKSGARVSEPVRAGGLHVAGGLRLRF